MNLATIAAKSIRQRWLASSLAQSKALGGCEASTRVPWVAGELAAITLATTRLAEVWIHTGDVGAALGRRQEPGPHLKPIARLAWRTLPYAFARSDRTLSGPVALQLTTPDGTWEFTPDEPAATTVTVDNRASATSTVVEVRAPDRLGTLYRITRALADLHLDIRLAKVATLGHEVVDSFYVADAEGAKIADGEHAREVERAVLVELSRL